MCKGKGNLLSFIKAESGRVFGGYHSEPLPKNCVEGEIKDPTAFIYSVSDSQKFELQNGKASEAFKYDSYYGPTFGKIWSDIYVSQNFKGCHANFGHSYQLPKGKIYNSENTKSYLAGTENFNVSELEVYQLQD